MSPKGLMSAMILLLTLPLAEAAFHLEQPEHVCVSGCVTWAGKITWNVSEELLQADYYTEICTNMLKLSSIYYCIQQYCTPQDIYAGLDFYNVTCLEEAGVALPRFETLAASQHHLAKVTRLSEDDYIANPEAISEPVLPDVVWAAASIRTIKAYDQNFWYSFDFTWASYGFWGLVCLISVINRAVELVKASLARPATRLRHSSSIWRIIRRHLVLPATFEKHCQEPLGWVTLPPRLQSIIIVTYILMSIIMCFPGYDLFNDNQYWPTVDAQLVRYIADRTAILAIANVPLLWLFAARNDPLLWLTGFSYASYNRFHRWVARLAFALAMVHSIVWTYDYIHFYGIASYYAAYQEVWFYTGVIATVVMALLLPASVYWLRNKHYDFFLITHILLSVIFLVTLYFHIQVYEGYFDGFVWPCVAIWTLDRLIRILRVIYASVIPRILRNAKAVATYDAAADIIRLDVTSFFSMNRGISPGLYYYVYLPASIKGWESHPFTLCSWKSLGSAPLVSSPIPPPDEPLDLKRSELHSRLLDEDLKLDNIRHSFLIRPYKGFTQRLRDAVQASQKKHGSARVTVLIEGPYGVKLDLSRYSDVLIIVAGSAVVTAISHAYHLLANGRTEVYLTWIVPREGIVHDICENELAAILSKSRLHVSIYLTSSSQDEVSKSTSEDNIEFHFGRPDILAVMRQVRSQCRSSLAIVNSGIPQVVDGCRASVVELLKEPGPQVEYCAEDTPW